MSAGLESGVQMPRVSGIGPIPGRSLPLAGGGPGPASSRLNNAQMTATDQDMLPRLALWLADVAAEATLAATTPPTTAIGSAGGADEPPVVESAS